MDRIFQLLFKYRPIVFEQGDFSFAAPPAVRLWIIVAVLAAGAATATYARVGGMSSPAQRGGLAVLRLALFAVLAFALLQPILTLSTVVPQQNFVGVLIDDSRSMTLKDLDGAPRSAFVREVLDPESGSLVRALSERFSVRLFRFSDLARRIDGVEDLTFSGTRSNLSRALDVAREELAGVPLSGLVVITDGASNDDRTLAEALVPLQAAGVPVFTVGVGPEEITPDIEIGRVQLPRDVLDGSTLVADVVITQRGQRARRVPLVVEDERRILAQDTVELGPEGEPVVARIGFQLDQQGPHRVRFRVPVQPGERVSENNTRELQVEVRGGREKILYFEGEPRFEVKFMRRAVADDGNVQLVVLQRTAESKFLRLEVSDSTELEFGFPTSREELYRYRGLILGSVEASFFTHDQLQMIADFVSARGGGVLFLGGHDAFAEGGWAGTPVEEVIPVLLDAPAGGPDGFFAEMKISPTPAGLAHPSLRLDATGDAIADRWSDLPPLTAVNRISRVRAGATVLLTGEGAQLPDEQVVLAFQRYGRGKAAALTAQDTWLWQMHAEIPLEDQRHEIFWQQTLRWLLDGVPGLLTPLVEQDEVEPGTSLRVRALVRDSAHLEVGNATVSARIVDPLGAIEELPLTAGVDHDGEYALEFRPRTEGTYEIELRAERDGELLSSAITHVTTGPSTQEYFGAARQTPLLRRLAEETGGVFYASDEVDALPEDLAIVGAGVTLEEERDLWDMPAIFILLILLLAAEWGLRRWRGLA